MGGNNVGLVPSLLRANKLPRAQEGGRTCSRRDRLLHLARRMREGTQVSPIAGLLVVVEVEFSETRTS